MLNLYFPSYVCDFKIILVAKPLVADGSAKSHELSLAYEHFSLQNLEPPLVLQEFVNHGKQLLPIYTFFTLKCLGANHDTHAILFLA